MPKAPFPYFGGKSMIAGKVWAMLGECRFYAEPFVGSAAVLLLRPNGGAGARTEVVNDWDANVVNFWRAVRYAPLAVADACDFPPNHSELVARRAALREGAAKRREKCEGDVNWYDARAAGMFAWVCSASIGGASDLVKVRSMPQVLGRRALFSAVAAGRDAVEEWMLWLSRRLRGVSALCMDWGRMLEHTVNRKTPRPAGIFLDPPYAEMRGDRVYQADSPEVSGAVRRWCAEFGRDPTIRIVLCGYQEEHDELLGLGWRKVTWQARKGRRGEGNDTNGLERLWCSPGCLAENMQMEIGYETEA